MYFNICILNFLFDYFRREKTTKTQNLVILIARHSTLKSWTDKTNGCSDEFRLTIGTIRGELLNTCLYKFSLKINVLKRVYLHFKIIVRIPKSTITSFIHIFLTPYAVNMQWAAWCYVNVRFIPSWNPFTIRFIFVRGESEKTCF